MVSVVLVEADRTESAFACIAIALRRPRTKVVEVRSLGEAKARLVGDAPRLVILGWTALHDRLESFFKGVPPCTAVVGLAANVSRDGLDRALRAGVKKVYGKPTEWRAYVNTIESIFRDSLAIRAGAEAGEEADRCLSC